MGFNTALMVCNDDLERIAKADDVGLVIRDLTRSAQLGKEVDGKGRFNMGVSAGRYAISALPPRHADDCQLVLIGHNSMQLVGLCWSTDPVEALRQVADQLGYTLHLKPQKAMK